MQNDTLNLEEKLRQELETAGTPPQNPEQKQTSISDTESATSTTSLENYPQEIHSPDKDNTKSNSWRQWLILSLGCVIILAGCATAYFFFSKSSKDKNAGDSSDTTGDQTVEISTDPIFSADNFPRMDGSTATQPLMLAMYKNFTGNDGAKLADFNWNQTHQAYENLIAGNTDLIVVTQPSEDELNLASQAGITLEVTPVVREGFVFYVSSDNPVENLTTAQIQDIYQGKITNWKDVGGEDKEIKAYQRNRNSGSQTGMIELVMQGKPLMDPITEDIMVGSMAAIVGLVSSYNNASDAIGYSYYYYITTMYDEIDQNVADGVKLLAIDDIEPTTENIQAERYPFKTSYYIVTRSDASEQTIALKDAMLSPRGQKVAKEARYVPVN